MPKNFVDVHQELFLWIWLSLTARRTHFEGQTSPVSSIPLISTIFVCYRKPFVWWSEFQRQKCQKFLWTSVKNFFYESGYPSRPVQPILKVKRASKRAYPSFRLFSCAIANHFLDDSDSDVKMPNFFVDVLQDLIYASDWPSRPFWPFLKIKRATKRAYPSFRWFSSSITNHFLGDPDSDV